MKKVLLIATIAFVSFQFSNAQELGVRFGNVVRNYAAVDIVWGINSGRIHGDVSFGDGVGVVALWDFLYGPLGDEPLYYYIGVGAYTWIGDPFRLGASAEAGLEYRFKSAPFVLGLDWRPTVQIIEYTHFHPNRFGLNLRFVF
jgi:hypothetical protein